MSIILRRAVLIGLVLLGLALWGWGFVVAFELKSLGATSGGEDPIISALWQTSLLGFLGVGALLVEKRPNNPIGWVLLVTPILFWSPVSEAVELSRARGDAPSTLAVQVNWLMHGLGSPLLLLTALFLLLAFPNGEFTALGRRILRIAVPVTGLTIPVRLIAPGPMDGAALPNPHAIDALGDLGAVLQGAGEVVALLVLPALWDLVRRYRMSRGAERQQFRWVVRAIVAAPIAFLVVVPLGEALFPKEISQYTDLLGIWLAMGSISAAFGVSILRYRLWDIDRVVSRTVAYTLVMLLLVGVYLASVLAIQSISRPLAGDSDLAVAVSTLLAAALFQPVRRRVTSFVDRRFNRIRYDAEQTVGAFAGQLRDELDLGALRDELLRTTSGALGPAHCTLLMPAPEGRK
ncbi:MAG: hypothetical protein R3343_05855 [Nitriliruptorales bacterium]|nr:hypothetical protein [Nitriliruptorales bacterium]